MPQEFIPQQDEHYQAIVPEASQESIDDFLKTLEADFDYPALSHLSSTPADVIDPTPAEEIDEETDDNEPVPPVVPDEITDPVQPQTVLVNGQQVPLADVQRLWEFDQFLRSNPDAAERVQQAVTPPQSPVPPAAETPPANEVTPPEFLDLEDPKDKFFWDQILANKQQLDTFTRQAQQIAEAESQRRYTEDAECAVANFRTQHPNFNDDQILSLRQHARDMNIIGALAATTSNLIDAFSRNLELAAMDSPDLRTIYLTPEEPPVPTTRQRSDTRKSKLNSLGGSSGSVPRTTPVSRPMSDREATDQFAAGLAEAFQQN